MRERLAIAITALICFSVLFPITIIKALRSEPDTPVYAVTLIGVAWVLWRNVRELR